MIAKIRQVLGVRVPFLPALCCLTVLFASAGKAVDNSTPASPVVRCQRVEIVNAAGEPVMQLGTASDGAVGLFMGSTEAGSGSIQINRDGNPMVIVCGPAGKPLVGMLANIQGAAASLTVGGGAGDVVLQSDPNNTLGLAAYRTDKRPGRLMLSVLNNGAAGLTVTDDGGRMRGVSPTDGDR